MHCHREGDLEKLVLLLPVNLGLEPQHPRPRVEDHALVKLAGTELAGESHDGAQRPIHLDGRAFQRRDVG